MKEVFEPFVTLKSPLKFHKKAFMDDGWQQQLPQRYVPSLLIKYSRNYQFEFTMRKVRAIKAAISHFCLSPSTLRTRKSSWKQSKSTHRNDDDAMDSFVYFFTFFCCFCSSVACHGSLNIKIYLLKFLPSTFSVAWRWHLFDSSHDEHKLITFFCYLYMRSTWFSNSTIVKCWVLIKNDVFVIIYLCFLKAC